MTYEQYLESKKERVAQSGFSISDDELNPIASFDVSCERIKQEQMQLELF